MKKMEGKSLQVEGVQRALELPESEVLTKEKEQQKEKKKVRCSKTRKKWFNGVSEKIEEQLLDKFQVGVSKRGAYKGRGQPSEWRMVQRVKKISFASGDQNFCVVQGIRLAAKARNAGEPNRKGGGEHTAAKYEDHDRYDKGK